MIPFPIPWRLIGVVAAVLAVLSAGIWFKGVLSDRAELSRQNGAQAAELVKVNGEVAAMNLQKAQDAALFEQIEQQRAIHAAEIRKQGDDIKKLRKELSLANQECYSHILPDDYLDRLP
jgi:hypothetical protein